MLSVQLDSSTKLNSLSILTEINITDDYLKQHSAAPEVQHLTTQRDGLLDSPFFNNASGGPEALWRMHSSSATDAAKYTDTTSAMIWSVEADNLKNLAGDAFMLQGFVDQPTLKALPLYSRFVDAVKALSMPEGDTARSAQTVRDGLAVSWGRSSPCHAPNIRRGFRILL
jgi:hypothetical protein